MERKGERRGTGDRGPRPWGTIRYLYAGNDFADRPGEDEVFGALDTVTKADAGDTNGTAQTRATAEEAESSTVRPDRPPMSLEQLVVYYRAVFFVTVALKRRFGELKDRTAFGEVDRYQRMGKEYQGAIGETREAQGHS